LKILQANFDLPGRLLIPNQAVPGQLLTAAMTGENLLLNSRIFWLETTERFPALKLADFPSNFVTFKSVTVSLLAKLRPPDLQYV
jgi:hypothetical protein